MSRQWDLRINEGFCIHIPDGPIDMIVRGISGSKRKRDANVEIRGPALHSSADLEYSGGLTAIARDVHIEIKGPHRRASSDKVPINCITSYRITVENYDSNNQ